MRKYISILLFIFTTCVFAQTSSNPIEYVNPLIGTDSEYELSNGNTYPAIARPWE